MIVLQRWRKLLLLFLFTFFYGCATEDAVIYDNPTAEGTVARIIYRQEIDSLPGVSSKLQKLRQPKPGETAKPVHSGRYDFTVDTEQALLAVSGNYRSLTFPISYNEQKEELQNLFLHPYNGGYLTFLLKYNLTPQEMGELNRGKEIDRLGERLAIVPLPDLDIDLGAGISFASGDLTAREPGEPFWHNGVCSVHGTSIINPDGTISDMTILPCPDCECPKRSGGGSTGGAGPFVGTRLFFALIDLIAQNPSGSGSGGSGSGGGSIAGPFNPAPKTPGGPIESYPLPIFGAVSPDLPKPDKSKNCDELRKMSAQAGVTNALRDLKNKLSLQQETGYSFKADGAATVATALPPGVINGSTIRIPTGGNIIGAAHTHYDDGYSIPMFSPQDIIKFYDIVRRFNYNGGNPNHMINTFVFTVTTAQGTYAIKADSTLFHAEMQAIISDPEKLKDFIDELKEQQERKPSTDSPESFQKQFLEFLQAQGLSLSLFKADDNLGGWGKVSLDPGTNSGVKQVNCI